MIKEREVRGKMTRGKGRGRKCDSWISDLFPESVPGPSLLSLTCGWDV